MPEIPSKILTISSKNEEKFLRQKTKDFVFLGKAGAEGAGKILKKQGSEELIRKMRRIMRQAKGVGLSANQIGLPFRMFVAEIPDYRGNPKFYAIFNPKIEIEKEDKKKIPLEEGCLSVPGTYGQVERASRVKLTGFNKAGRSITIRAWGLQAQVFQHEVEHLDGKLFIDKAKSLHRAITKESPNP